MTSLDLVQNAITQSNPADTPSEDQILQTHFDKIVSLVEREKILEAATIIEKILAKGILDIRLLVYYLYAHFLNHGIKSFKEIFPRFSTLIHEHWVSLKPLDRKDKQVQNSLNWFVTNIVSKLKYFEKLAKTGKMHPIWIKSTEELTPQELEEISQITIEFKDFIYEKWPKSPAKERTLHLLQMIEDIKLLKEPDPVPEIIEEQSETEWVKKEESMPAEIIEQKEAASQEEIVPVEESIVDTIEETFVKEPTLEPSLQPSPLSVSLENMQNLIDKLKIFELLIKKNDFVKASLVAKDIDSLLENFDPLLYFPKLFSNYFSLVARNMTALSEQWKEESLQLKYLEKLYKTDPQLFIEL